MANGRRCAAGAGHAAGHYKRVCVCEGAHKGTQRERQRENRPPIGGRTTSPLTMGLRGPPLFGLRDRGVVVGLSCGLLVELSSLASLSLSPPALVAALPGAMLALPVAAIGCPSGLSPLPFFGDEAAFVAAPLVAGGRRSLSRSLSLCSLWWCLCEPVEGAVPVAAASLGAVV